MSKDELPHEYIVMGRPTLGENYQRIPSLDKAVEVALERSRKYSIPMVVLEVVGETSLKVELGSLKDGGSGDTCV